MKKSILFLSTLTLLLASTIVAAEETWSRKADMPTATSLHGAVVVDGKIYIIGGTDYIYGWTDYWFTVFLYDPLTDTWTRKADMPAGRARLCASVVDGRIYVIGGAPHRDSEVPTVEVYDPATDTWTRKTDMPRARNFLSSSVVDGKIYVIGGKIYPSETMVATVEVYDPSTDTWTRKADMPTARGMHSASVVNGKIYVIGGVTGAYGPFIPTVEMYDPATDTWTRKTDMPTRRAGHTSSALNGTIYVIGGANVWDSCLSTMELYDPATDTWTTGPDMPTARGAHSASVVDGRIYTIGGMLGISSWTSISTVEVYDTAPPPPDFNGDGRVDGKDLLIMTEHWGQAYPLCDLGPLPFGDGVVDLEDVIVFADFIGKEIHDPTLIAHWTLDETEGMIAGDSVGGNDATLVGEPVWRPEAGAVDGALEFDGATFATTDSVLDPAKGPFSVLAWVKGGAPGQVMISQQGGVNWLMTDAVTGALMTELSKGGRTGVGLLSATIITDGTWHRIGFTWDGSHRQLYVDDVLVAEDAQGSLAACSGKLVIGAGKNVAPGSFWTGLIDDVRIYSRAVQP